MVNYILLEGIEMYVFLILLFLLIIATAVFFLAMIKNDVKIYELREALFEEREKNIVLNRENISYKLKHGELDTGNE